MASKRNRKKQSSRKKILIVCEGKDTERLYLNGWKEHLEFAEMISIPIKSAGAGHSAVVKKAKTLRQQQAKKAKRSDTDVPYNEIWCVFDTEEEHQHPGKLKEAIDLAQQHEFETVISNPCIEIWYLWHFSRSRPSSTCNNLKKTVGEKHIQGYHESMDVFDKVRPHTQKAMKQAMLVLRQSDKLYPRPSTTMPELLCNVFFSNALPHQKRVKQNEDDGERHCRFSIKDRVSGEMKSSCWFCQIIENEGENQGQ